MRSLRVELMEKMAETAVPPWLGCGCGGYAIDVSNLLDVQVVQLPCQGSIALIGSNTEHHLLR